MRFGKLRALGASLLVALSLVTGFAPANAGTTLASNSLVTAPQQPVFYETHNRDVGNYTTATSDLGGTSRQFFNAIANIKQFRFLFTNYYNGGSGETNVGTPNGPLTVMASIEDPNNLGTVLMQLTFNGGQSSCTIAVSGFCWTDPIDLDVSAGQTIVERTYMQAAAVGNVFPQNILISPQSSYISSSGAGLGFNAADTTTYGNNYTQKGGNGSNQLATNGTSWIASSSTVYGKQYGPTAGIGTFAAGVPPLPSTCVDGDSIAAGFNDQPLDGLGYIMRALRLEGIPSITLASPSEYMATMGASPYTNYRVRRTELNLCSQDILEYGINDVETLHSSLATLKAAAIVAAQAIINRGGAVYADTLTPNTTSSDNWTTVGNQSVTAYESVRTSWNTLLRSWTPNSTDPLLKLLSGVYDPASLVEVNSSNVLTLNGGYWLVNGTSGYCTSDGLHPTTACNVLEQAALIVAQYAGIGGTSGVQFFRPLTGAPF